MPMRRLLAAASLTLLAGVASATDRVVLEGGAAAEGEIVSESETSIVLRQRGKDVEIPRRLVKSVERDVKKKDPAPGARDEPAARGDGGSQEPAARDAGAGDAAPAEAKPSAKLGTKAAEGKGEVDPKLVALMESPENADKRAAIDQVVAGWPGTKASLEAMLEHRSGDVRLVATQILEREEIGDTLEWVRKRMSDEAASVRQTAVRAARLRDYHTLEPRVIELLQYDADPSVRAETLRFLEDRGSGACLDVVLAQFEHEKDKGGRRRLLRVLKRHTGESHGEDIEAWREAVKRAPRPQQVDGEPEKKKQSR